MATIYGFADPRNGALRYVGQTRQPVHRRLKDHLKSNFRSRVRDWLRKLRSIGMKPVIQILESDVVESDVNDAEVFWIAYFKSTGAVLLNMTDGGGFENKSREACMRIAEKLRGRKRPAWIMERLRQSNIGRVPSAETRAKMAAAQRGRKHSLETRLKMSASAPRERPDLRGPKSPEHHAKLVENFKRYWESKPTVSGIRGVVWDKSRGNWKASYYISRNKNKYLGAYPTKEQAAEAVNRFRREYAAGN